MNTILELFSEQVERNPGGYALKFKDRLLTYSDLNIESNKVAGYLNSIGIHTGSKIAISLERSEKIVIYILGVLKAGAAYIFLDPVYPAERLNNMLNISNPDLLICSKESIQWIQNVNVRILDLNNIDKASDDFTSENISPLNLAYLMFTSGTTGKPKAVMINHANLLSYLPSINTIKKVTDQDVCLHTASFSFSSSVRQLFIPLLNGAKIVIAAEDEKANLPGLLRLIKLEGITVIDTVQSLWRYGLSVIDSMRPDEHEDLMDNNLRLILFSGDILPKFLVERIRFNFRRRSVQIVNLYGQTETIGGIAFPIPSNYSETKGYTPIGFPLPHMKAYILDENLKPVKKGEAGEIFVSGGSLSEGYYNDSETTKRAFIGKLDFEGAPEKIFRTGDIGKINDLDAIEILGRVDFQVKIRGIRIELAEIETAMVSHPEIKDAIVAAHEKNEGEKYLVGYYILEESSALSNADIREFLRKRLPDNMVPSWFMKLEKFQLTPNGKIDRKALPVPQNYIPESLSNRDTLTNTQKHLALIYTNLLGIDAIDIDASFFDIGGHSLLAVQLTEMIERILGKKIPVNQIYQTPSVARLAAKLDSISIIEPYTPMVNLQPFGDNLPCFIVHGDDSSFLLPRYLGEEIPFYGFFHQGQDGSHMQYKTIDNIAKVYADEIEKIKLKSPIVLGGYSIGGVIAFEMACILQEKGHTISKLILLDSLAPKTHAQVLKGEFKYDKENNVFVKTNRVAIMPNAINNTNNQLLDRIKNKFFIYRDFLACKYYLLTNQLIPSNLRNFYIMGTYRKARKIYKGNKYQGDAILFRSTIDNFNLYDLGWNHFIEGNLEIIEVLGDHHTTIREPAIAQVGLKIREIILSAKNS